MHVQPYVFFDGCCEEALEFYKKALGAEVTMLMRFKECPETPKEGMVPPGSEDKVMHASFRIGETEILASDGNCRGKTSFDGFSLTINVANDAEAKKTFDAMVDGGQVVMPLGKTFFASQFGMLVDRFGVHWMVIAGQ